MRDPRDRWIAENADQGQYSCLAGFERDIGTDDFDSTYTEMDIDEKVALFVLVNKWLDEKTISFSLLEAASEFLKCILGNNHMRSELDPSRWEKVRALQAAIKQERGET
jgi:hypothetical protein